MGRKQNTRNQFWPLCNHAYSKGPDFTYFPEYTISYTHEENAVRMQSESYTGSCNVKLENIPQIGWETKGVRHLADPPSKIQIRPQPTVAGVGTSQSGVGTDESIHAIMFSSLTQVLQLFTTSSCPRRPLYQLSHCSYFLISYFLSQHLRYFWFISPYCF